jgi:hypothetical protein
MFASIGRLAQWVSRPLPISRRLTVVLLVATALAGCVAPQVTIGGPLVYDWARDYFGAPGDADSDITFGWAGLRNSGTQAAIVDAVSIEEANGITLVDSYVVRVADIPYGVADYPRFPPDGWEEVLLVPASGFAVPSYLSDHESDYYLILHLKVSDEAGAHVFDGVTVDYHVGTTAYTVTMPYRLLVCVPSQAVAPPGAPDQLPPLLVDGRDPTGP